MPADDIASMLRDLLDRQVDIETQVVGTSASRSATLTWVPRLQGVWCRIQPMGAEDVASMGRRGLIVHAWATFQGGIDITTKDRVNDRIAGVTYEIAGALDPDLRGVMVDVMLRIYKA